MEVFNEPNPILQQENFYSGYQKSIEDLKNSPESIEFDKLCYEIFEMNAQGKRFLELVKERYVVPAIVSRGTPTYQIDVIWAEGFKEFPRLCLSAIHAHKQRIIAGTKK